MTVRTIFLQYMLGILGPLLVGYLADLIFGDPHNMWHPICFIGNMISCFEKKLRRLFPNTKQGERSGGVCLVISVLFVSAAIPAVLLLIAYRIRFWLGFLLQSYMCYTILATKSLRTESMKVYYALRDDGIEAGRYAVSMIVGRDTQNLDRVGVTKAAVETIAENTSDGIIAPMIYMVIGGPVLGYVYKAANTMDSMVGYKNDKYRHFGTAAAKFDDVVNYIPARLSALFMILSASLIGLNGREAWRIWRRDRRNHASPNSAQTESVTAGALGVQLAGDAWYFGEKHEKPFIGDPTRDVELEDIPRANRLLYATSAVSLVILMLIRFVVERCIIF